MNPHLSIGVVVDTQVPAAWVVDLLQRLSTNKQFELTVVSAQSHSLNKANAYCNSSSKKNLIETASRWWMMHKIDRPQFKHDPWINSAIPSGIKLKKFSDNKNTLALCDLILDLCTNTTLDADIINLGVPCWSANIQNLDERAEHYLLSDAPLMWLHLWEIRKGHQHNTSESKHISSHSLPRQTFSITDLRRLCFYSLPSLFESRLIWYAKGYQCRANIDLHEFNKGVFAEEHEAAKADAQIWQNTTYLPQAQASIGLALKIARLSWRQLAQRIRARFLEEHWQLAMYENASNRSALVDSLPDIAISEYKDLARSKNAVWADPHVLRHNDEHYVFFEQKHSHDKHAHIAVAKLDHKGQLGDPSVVLEESFHLSYPFVFESDGEHYMIPETASQRCVRLYKANSFPRDWHHVANLIEDTDSVDTTLTYQGNRWWMFTNCHSHRCVDERDELHIYMADQLLGPWQPHPLNPVLTGVDRSRMAGPIVSENGLCYRVSQYGAYRYGRGINISKIDELTPTAYAETALYRIAPCPGSRWLGCHSLGFANRFILMDRVRYRLRSIIGS